MDDNQFEALFRAHYADVLRYALARADADAAKEAAAQTFFVAWRRRKELPERALPWLLGVTRRALADQRRATRRRGNLTDRLVLHRLDSAPVADPADDVAERSVVLAALQRIPPSDREALELVAWDGLSAPDAAAVLGCSRPAFAVRLSRARKRFSLALARLEGAELPSPPVVSVPHQEMQ